MWRWLSQLFGRASSPAELREPAPPAISERRDGAANTVAPPALSEQAAARPPQRRRRLRPRKTRVFVCAVVGESFANEDGANRQNIIRNCTVGEAVLLVPEPHNRFDPDAVAVRRAIDSRQLGYLRRDVASRLIDDIGNQFAATGRIHAIRGGGAPGWLYGVTIEITLTDIRGAGRA